jgi:hypothetical protein
MLNIPGHQGNATQNHIKIPLHPRVAIIKNTNNNKFVGETAGKKEPAFHWWKCKLVQPL